MQDKDKYILKTAASEIVIRMKRLTAIWEELDYFTAHGVVKPDKNLTLQQQIEEMDIGEVLRLYDNLPPLICKWKKKLDKMPEGPQKESMKINLALKESELEAIKSLKNT